MSAPVALYRQFDAADRLLYIGITNNPKRRLWEHKCRAVWAEQIARVDVVWLRSREEAAQAEREAIAAEAPIFNGGAMQAQGPTGDALRDWMTSTGMTQSDIAEAYGISQATLSKMMTGKARTSLRFAVWIEDLSEGAVPVRYWMFGATAEVTASTGVTPLRVVADEAAA